MSVFKKKERKRWPREVPNSNNNPSRKLFNIDLGVVANLDLSRFNVQITTLQKKI